MTDEPEVMRGSGNLFADLGDADADARKMKAVIAAEIIATLNARGLSAREGAKVARVDAADIQRIRNADLSRFTIDRLVRVAYRLGRRVEMNVLPVDVDAAA
ncbi:MAG: XRE family transcriptional regulator [Methylocystis sp.]|nr:XRE family transcriptional regulator [Methylocystis sp.]MCA3584970.1 XRE family transcriptional regulator [Methylocystis sp.]MCA3586900.1 XRE family transcriptional regulator [Methylocystis sp.]MCA3592188.1 XRE family transcriptional regulator [Methylocystis sp.]